MRQEISRLHGDTVYFQIPGEEGEMIPLEQLEKHPHALRHVIEALLEDENLDPETKLMLAGFLKQHGRMSPTSLQIGE